MCTHGPQGQSRAAYCVTGTHPCRERASTQENPNVVTHSSTWAERGGARTTPPTPIPRAPASDYPTSARRAQTEIKTPHLVYLKENSLSGMQCEDCGKVFETTLRVKRFCSEECRRRTEKRRWKRKKLHAVQERRFTKTGLMPGESRCRICGTVFERINNNSCYCSQECRAIGHEETKVRGRENAKKRYQERQERKHQP